MAAFDGKTVLVLGGSRGIGAAIVRRFAADGALVTFTYAGSAEALYYMAHALRRARFEIGYMNDPLIFENPLPALLDADYHKLLAGVLKSSRPKTRPSCSASRVARRFAAWKAKTSRSKSPVPSSSRT